MRAELSRLVGAEHVLEAPPGSPYNCDATRRRGVDGTRRRGRAARQRRGGRRGRALVLRARRADRPARRRHRASPAARCRLDGGVVLSLERLRARARLDPALWRMHVEAGVHDRATCAAWRARTGCSSPPDPGAAEQSQIGGNVATNAGGPHAFKYGVTGRLGDGARGGAGAGRARRGRRLGRARTWPATTCVAADRLGGHARGHHGGLAAAAARRRRPRCRWSRSTPRRRRRLRGDRATCWRPGMRARGARVPRRRARSRADRAGGFPRRRARRRRASRVIAEVDGSRAEADAQRAELARGCSAAARARAARARATAEAAALWRWRDGVNGGGHGRARGQGERGHRRAGRTGSAEAIAGFARDRRARTASRRALGARGRRQPARDVARRPGDEAELDAAEAAGDGAVRAGGRARRLDRRRARHRLDQARASWQRSGARGRSSCTRQIKRAFDPKGLLNPGKKLAG